MSRSAVVRVGSTLRRPSHAESDFVAGLLQHLRAAGFDRAPLPLGVDAEGRDVFEWVEGEVPAAPPFRLDDEQLRGAARLMREFHDTAASLPERRSEETVAHGDLGPHNTVFRDGLPVAIIDWDADVAPGRRLDDFAQGAWGYADLLEDAVPVERQRQGLAVLCSAYGGVSPEEVLTALRARFVRARDDHGSHGRDRARAVFEELLEHLDGLRSALLGGAHDRESAVDA